MIHRLISSVAAKNSKKYPIVVITGPRQSGKTTLVKKLFPKIPYVLLEDLDTRERAITDPRGFLAGYPNGAIFDEVQRVPELFSYLQGVVDRPGKKKLFVLTGSQNFLLLENISQSLAGRSHIMKLLPFSLEEMEGTRFFPKTMEEAVFKGCYPRIYEKKIDPTDWYSDYVQTYIERDVRQLKNIGDLHRFQKFLRLCASRTGQMLNMNALANDCGITHNTAGAWISILEASYLVFLISPHHKNFNKRVVKMPKLYFYDTGLACFLMGLADKKQVATHPFRGALFETLMISEWVKWRLNRGLGPNIFFWRDKTGHEVDCLLEKKSEVTAVELKSGATLSQDSFKELKYWIALSGSKKESFLVYTGDQEYIRDGVQVKGWKKAYSIQG